MTASKDAPTWPGRSAYEVHYTQRIGTGRRANEYSFVLDTQTLEEARGHLARLRQEADAGVRVLLSATIYHVERTLLAEEKGHTHDQQR